MSILTTELLAYASVNMTDVDSGTAGGAIDLTHRIAFTQMTAADTIKFTSTSASDTQNCTIEGRNAGGSIITETFALTGTTPKTSANTYSRILKITLASVAIGTITVQGTVGPGTNFATITILIGEQGWYAIFRKCQSAPGSSTTYYEKFFWKNTNGTLALTAPPVALTVDAVTWTSFGLETSVNGSNTSTNRITAPGTTTAFGTAAILLGTAVGGHPDLATTETIGVWHKLLVPAAGAAQNASVTTQLSGNTV